MSGEERDPPNPFPLNPIFNIVDWIQPPNIEGAIDIAYLDANYLKYPVAQGSETLQTINVNGLAQFLNAVTISQTLTISNNLTLNNAVGAKRTITASNYVAKDINNGATTNNTTFYQNGTACYIDNNAINGTISFAVDNTSSVQQIPLQVTATSVQTNKNIVMGSGTNITFPDATIQTTAFTSALASKVLTYTFTTNTTNFLIPANVYKIDIKCIGRGGNCGAPNGSFYGGSGAGAQQLMLISSPIIDGFYLNFTFVATVGTTIGYAQVQDAFNSTVIMRAYNGGDGGNATPTSGGTGGVVSPLVAPTNPINDSSYGSIVIYQGTNGATPTGTSPPSAVGLAKGSPPNTYNVGNGRLDSISTWPTAKIFLTCYYL